MCVIITKLSLIKYIFDDNFFLYKNKLVVLIRNVFEKKG